MADVQKVIKGFECCSGAGGQCIYCPYDTGTEDASCREGLDHDALELLKEQQKRIETLESLRRIEQEGR